MTSSSGLMVLCRRDGRSEVEKAKAERIKVTRRSAKFGSDAGKDDEVP